jgi:flagellar biosynthesis/type III secretory pathway protein FliH
MPVTSTTSSPIPRAPSFLEQIRGRVDRATFSGASTSGIHPFFERQGEAARQAEIPVIDTPSVVESLAPPLPPPIPQPGPEFAERLAKAVGELRRTGERLAEQTTADALEMAMLIARRIIEGELKTNPAALTGLIRSAIGRLGESRKVQLRLHPSDAANVQAAGDAGPLGGVSVARVEIRPDATLSPGDCIVDGEQGTVDGRVATRMEEVRRILARALSEEDGGR